MKHIDVDELFNRRVITSELESSLIDDDVIDASVVKYGKKKESIVEEVHIEVITVGEVGE